MPAEQSKALVADIYTESFNQGNFNVFYYSFSDDYRNHDHAIPDHGNSRAYASFIATLRAAFPDLHITVEEQFSGEILPTTNLSLQLGLGEKSCPPTTKLRVRKYIISHTRYASGARQRGWIV